MILESAKRLRAAGRNERRRAYCSAVLGWLLLGMAWCVSAQPAGSGAGFAGSASCRECHSRFYTLWSTSFHGLAMQPYTAAFAKEKLKPQQGEIAIGGGRYQADISKGVVVERDAKGAKNYPIVQVTGGKNVYYFLAQLERGHLQVLPVAYDVRRGEWFDTTLSAMRHFGDRADAPLNWKERPLTFNSSCYDCHVSQLEKNYDLGTDSYSTKWAEPGINCETCHGPSAGHVELFRKLGTNQPAPADLKLIVTSTMTPLQRNEMCAPCHAKMSPLTDKFVPGERFFDHFDLTGLENPDFYPDGRDLGENYTYTQWLMSPCARSGKLDCMHCHTSSGRYRFTEPAQANNACAPCHEDKVADAAAHSHHKAGTAGSLCISCHMPMTEFARMKRTDHTMRPPAPAATVAFNSPNACNLCHTNGAAWADKTIRQWTSHDYQEPILRQGNVIKAARRADWKKLPEMLDALTNAREADEIFTASVVRLLEGCDQESKWQVIRKLMTNASPLVRAAAAEALGREPNTANTPLLLKAASDPIRLVRVRAAVGLAAVPEDTLASEDRKTVRGAIDEYVGSLLSRPDDMSSHYNLGNFHMARGQLNEAIKSFEVASRLQPDAVPPYVNAALAYNALGKNKEAEARLNAALRLEATNAAVNLNLGMLYAEMENPTKAEQSFRSAFKADPRSAQAAYNLAVLLANTKPAESLSWARKAADLQPREPKYLFTLAYYQKQQGQAAAAIKTLEDLLAKAPGHTESYALLESLYEASGNWEKARELCQKASANPALPEEVRMQFGARWRGMGR